MRVKLLHKKNKGLIALATIASLFMSCDKKKGQDNTNNNESQKIVGYVYTSTNGEGGNQIIKLARYSDGTLGQEKVYETGGKGGSDSSAPVNGDYDSQGAIQIIDNHLLAANTGDNTVTVFDLDKKTGELKKNIVVSSHGERPVSISYTKSNQEPNIYWVAVANQWGIPTALYDGNKYVELPSKDKKRRPF